MYHLQRLERAPFDKAIFVSIPLDWITSTPTQAQRILTLRPITRDGGANLASARSLNRYIKDLIMLLFKEKLGGYGSEKVSSDLNFYINISFLFKHARTRNWRDQNYCDTRSSISAIKQTNTILLILDHF